MKKGYIIAIVAVLISTITAIMVVRAQELDEQTQETTLLDAMPNAIIYQDSTITHLMEDHWAGRVRGEIEMQGWRVQIYSSNNQLVAKQEAEALKKQLESELTEPIYMDFIQPFWKVRIGNFRTVEEARTYRDLLVQQFPELQAESYPVRDVIKIRQ